MPENITDIFPECNWTVVKTFTESSKSWEEVKREVNRLPGNTFEGVVGVDHQFRRNKLKSLEYLFLHHHLSKFNLTAALNLIFAGEHSEVIAYKPEFIELFNNLCSIYDRLIKACEITAQHCEDNFKTRDLAGYFFTKPSNANDPLMRFAKGYVFAKVYDKKNLTPEIYLSQRWAKSQAQIKRLFKLDPELLILLDDE